MGRKLGDHFRNTMGVPAGKQPTESPLSVPAPVPFQPAPTLATPSKVPFQPPPALSSPSKAPPLGSETPKLSAPAQLPDQPAPALISPNLAQEIQKPPKLSAPNLASSIQEPPVLTAPTAPEFQGPPKLVVPAPTGSIQSPPQLVAPTAPVFQSPPKLEQPTAPVFQGPPKLEQPTAPVFQGPPVLVQPTPPVFQEPPNLLQPTPPVFQGPPALVQPTPAPFEPPPNLSKPAVIGPQEAPALITPTAPGFEPPPDLIRPTPPEFEPPPALSAPKTLRFQPPPPLLQPDPVNDKGGTKFYQPEAIGAPWEALAAQQINYLKSTLPATLARIGQTALPMPGNITQELLPSTIIAKALNVANEQIRNLENKYGYDQINNAGAQISVGIGNAMGVNYAPGGSYEQGTNAQRLDAVNQSSLWGVRGEDIPTPLSIFENRRAGVLEAKFRGDIQKDDQYWSQRLFRITSHPIYDDDDGLLDKEVTVREASRGRFTMMPFYFVDLRPDSNQKYRTLFFQPINLEISENLSPNWNMQNFMGRVDPVATYQNTTRQIEVSFKLVAVNPQDVDTIYKKISWLSSMVYPEYSPNLRYKSGPVVKLRIGNLVNASSPSIPLSNERPGVSGIITSLSYNYDPLWELENNWQLPRGVDVSLSFTVLHDLPIGIVNGKFGSVGSLDSDGIYSTPQELLDNGGDGSTSGPNQDPSNFVDPNEFREFGQNVSKPPASAQEQLPPDGYT